MRPPYEITPKALRLVSSLSEKLGEVRSARLIKPPTELRKKNRIKTIQSSLEIEGNTLTVEQITDLINNKRVVAPAKDILEVKNAIQVYANLSKFKVYELDSLLKAHGLLMKGLVDYPGQVRRKGVGIMKGNAIAHIAPPGERVLSLLKELFRYVKDDEELLLIKSCVFHYEFEFIHPFTDGNGRMGRLWQTMLLKEYSPVFEYLPIEVLIKERQKEYYAVLSKSDKEGSSTSFIEFMLGVINTALEELLRAQNLTITGAERMDLFRVIIGKGKFSRQDYLRDNKEISTATASRDLKEAVDNGILVKTGDKRLATYKFKK